MHLLRHDGGADPLRAHLFKITARALPRSFLRRQQRGFALSPPDEASDGTSTAHAGVRDTSGRGTISRSRRRRPHHAHPSTQDRGESAIPGSPHSRTAMATSTHSGGSAPFGAARSRSGRRRPHHLIPSTAANRWRGPFAGVIEASDGTSLVTLASAAHLGAAPLQDTPPALHDPAFFRLQRWRWPQGPHPAIAAFPTA